ncbi:unnamed protein product [Calypogeia fissa]
MVKGAGVWNNVKETIANELQDEDRLAAHLRLVRSVGLFLGSILVMRNFGELMAV